MILPQNPRKLIRHRVNYFFSHWLTRRVDLGRIYRSFINSTMRYVKKGYIVRYNRDPWVLSVDSKYRPASPSVWIFPNHVAMFMHTYDINPKRVMQERSMYVYGSASFWRWILDVSDAYFKGLSEVPSRMFECFYAGDIWYIHKPLGLAYLLQQDILSILVPSKMLLNEMKEHVNRALASYKSEVIDSYSKFYVDVVNRVLKEKHLIPLPPKPRKPDPKRYSSPEEYADAMKKYREELKKWVKEVKNIKELRKRLYEEELKRYDEHREILFQALNRPEIREAIEKSILDLKTHLYNKVKDTFGENFSIELADAIFPVDMPHTGLNYVPQIDKKRKKYKVIFSEQEIVFKINFPEYEEKDVAKMKYKRRGIMNITLLQRPKGEEEIWGRAGVEPARQRKLVEYYYELLNQIAQGHDISKREVKTAAKKLAETTTDMVDRGLIDRIVFSIPYEYSGMLIDKFTDENLYEVTGRTGIDFINWILSSREGRIYFLTTLLADEDFILPEFSVKDKQLPIRDRLSMYRRWLRTKHYRPLSFEEMILENIEEYFSSQYLALPPELGGSLSFSQYDLKEQSTIWIEGISFIEIIGACYIFNRIEDYKTGAHTIYGIAKGPVRIYVAES